MKNTSNVYLPIALVVLIAGVGVMLAWQHQQDERMAQERQKLQAAQILVEAELRELDQRQADLAAQINSNLNAIKSLSDQLAGIGSKDDMIRIERAVGKVEDRLIEAATANQQQMQSKADAAARQLENISAKMAEKPAVAPLRWAFVDRFKLREVARSALKQMPLTVEQDPDQNPELAKKLAEYNSIQYKLSSMYSMGVGFPSSPMSPSATSSAGDRKRAEDYEALQLKLASLRQPLAAYLRHKAGTTEGQNELIDKAIRKYAEGKFDLLLDKTFSDNDIFYRSSQPVGDVTQEIAAVLREMAGN